MKKIRQIMPIDLDKDGNNDNFWVLVDKINELVDAVNEVIETNLI